MSDPEVTREKLAAIWQALSRPFRPGHLGQHGCHEIVVRQGWAMDVEVQDLLWEMDERAEGPFRDGAFDFLQAGFGLHFVNRFRGPFSQKVVIGHRAVTAADAAVFVMQIERFGFSVDASLLVDALRPSFVKQKYATNSELSVIWHKKLRHKGPPVVLRVANTEPRRFETLDTHSGYKATALFDGDSVVALRVDAPKAGRQAIPFKMWLQLEQQMAGSRPLIEVG